ncbi:MAG: class I SAM-dependent methyltransferase [Gemmatimonadota bacterium]|jgi:SAM-dependent methyltransferase
MLDLVRLSPRRLFPPGGEELYRHVARLAKLSRGLEVLDVACGKGIALEYFLREHGVQGTGVEADSHLIAEAEWYFREQGLSQDVSFQKASSVDLPFRDEIFDVVVGEVGLAATVDPMVAIQELVRVARPGGRVVLIQLVWKAPVDEGRKPVLSEHLGARPLMAVELRRTLLDAGVSDLHTEDWTEKDTAFRSEVKKPFPDFAELFTLREKLGVLRRARKRWGWKGVWTVFHREREVHRLLTKERILGLNLLVGVKSGRPPDETLAEGESVEKAGLEVRAPGLPGSPEEEGLQTSGLPLFGSGDGDG